MLPKILMKIKQKTYVLSHFRRPSAILSAILDPININNALAHVIVTVLLLLLDIVWTKVAAKKACLTFMELVNTFKDLLGSWCTC